MGINKPIELSVKIISAIAAIGYIVYRLVKIPDLGETWSIFINNLEGVNIGMVVIALFLMPLIWGVEIQKWRFLMSKNYPVPFAKAIRAVLSGLSMALLTPNRVGEIATRVLVLPPEHRLKAMWLGSLGGLAQIVITLVFGLIGGSFMLVTTEKVSFSLLQNNYFIVAIGVLGGGLVLAGYFYLHHIVNWMSKWKWAPLKKGNFRILKEVNFQDKLVVLGFSALKYCIYLNTFFLIIRICDVPITWAEGLMSLSIIYLILTFIPMVTLAEVGVRGSVTLMVISLYANLPVNLLAASLFAWLLNIAVPSLVGLILLIKVKF